MPTVANGTTLASDLSQNRGDQIEVEVHPSLGASAPATVRVLGYRNLADMGDYREAVALAARTDTTPDITAVRHTDSDTRMR